MADLYTRSGILWDAWYTSQSNSSSIHHWVNFASVPLSFLAFTSFMCDSGGPQPTTLHKATLRVVNLESCRRKYGPAAPGGIISSYLCAGTDGKDSCQVSPRRLRNLRSLNVSWAMECVLNVMSICNSLRLLKQADLYFWAVVVNEHFLNIHMLWREYSYKFNSNDIIKSKRKIIWIALLYQYSIA